MCFGMWVKCYLGMGYPYIHLNPNIVKVITIHYFVCGIVRPKVVKCARKREKLMKLKQSHINQQNTTAMN